MDDNQEEDNLYKWIAETFERKKTEILHVMQKNMEIEKQLKSPSLQTLETNISNLNKYNNMSKTLNESNEFSELILYLNDSIKEKEKCINIVNKDIRILKAKKRSNSKCNRRNKRTVKTLTKLLFEQYDKNSEMENSPLGLKNGIEELNTENLIEADKPKMEDSIIKEYDLLVAKRKHLEEMISISTQYLS